MEGAIITSCIQNTPTPLQLREETLLLINCQLLKPFVAQLILLDANTF